MLASRSCFMSKNVGSSKMICVFVVLDSSVDFCFSFSNSVLIYCVLKEMETEEDSLLYQCVQYINKARHADIIVSLAETMPNSLITVAICKLCYFVLLISKSSVDIGSRFVLFLLL